MKDKEHCSIETINPQIQYLKTLMKPIQNTLFPNPHHILYNY
jgi:hypothetical protein